MAHLSASQAKRRRPGVHVGLALRDCRLLEVTARMGAGAIVDPVWPQPLDGLLASVARRERLGESYGLVVDHHVQDLPLGRCRLAGQRWHWLATAARPAAHTVDDLQHWAKRVDEEPAERVVGVALTKYITTGGRYRSHWTPVPVTQTLTWTWRAIGDPDRLAALLDIAQWIGKKRAQGVGRIIGWDVTDRGPVPTWADAGHGGVAWAHWWDDGRPARPIPAREAETWGMGGCATIIHGYRPPYWQAPNGQGRLPDCIHPDERRPTCAPAAAAPTDSTPA